MWRVKLFNAAKSGRLAGGIAERTAQKWAKKLKEDKDWIIFKKHLNILSDSPQMSLLVSKQRAFTYRNNHEKVETIYSQPPAPKLPPSDLMSHCLLQRSEPNFEEYLHLSPPICDTLETTQVHHNGFY
ncbi:hypothetical protein BDF20DRAFT_840228 [Mycotypha africana]|uniref:uncharacterized protein n=1 Tax=Mycotypha africana TaxID=64632 RepID=UPI00230162BC|nr:uncharacterized protein BDF20DRAFT_840228 [Mycotypha africana]KAI8967374.1 hypothetical protein BDF20DRAFT_840228 [Mycotypha africana]